MLYDNLNSGFVIPTYFLEPPVNVADFLGSISIDASVNHDILSVVTYGSTFGACGTYLKRALREKGLQTVAHGQYQQEKYIRK